MNIPLQALLGSNRMDLLIESLNLNFSSSVHSFVSNFLPADCNMRMINRKILLFFFFFVTYLSGSCSFSYSSEP